MDVDLKEPCRRNQEEAVHRDPDESPEEKPQNTRVELGKISDRAHAGHKKIDQGYGQGV